jgi:hypothetical protein
MPLPGFWKEKKSEPDGGPTASCMESGVWIKNMEGNRSVSGLMTLGGMLLEFFHDNAGLEALHFHGELKQSKIGLPLAFSELPK